MYQVCCISDAGVDIHSRQVPARAARGKALRSGSWTQALYQVGMGICCWQLDSMRWLTAVCASVPCEYGWSSYGILHKLVDI